MIVWLAVRLLTMLACTWRIRMDDVQLQSTAVVAFWHDSMLHVWWAYRKKNATAMVSMSKDGSYLATILKHWGYSLARGSSTQGGSEALSIMVEAARNGVVMLTPDGPRGPRHKAKAGAVIAAMRSGAPLLAIHVEMTKTVVFKKSWDLFQVPLPFSAVHFRHIQMGVVSPLATPVEVESMITRIENEMSGFTKRNR